MSIFYNFRGSALVVLSVSMFSFCCPKQKSPLVPMSRVRSDRVVHHDLIGKVTLQLGQKSQQLGGRLILKMQHGLWAPSAGQ